MIVSCTMSQQWSVPINKLIEKFPLDTGCANLKPLEVGHVVDICVVLALEASGNMCNNKKL